MAGSKGKNIKKLIKLMPHGKSEELDRMDERELNIAIAAAAKGAEAFKTELAEHPEINAAKDALGEMTGPYTDAIKGQQAVVKYAMHLLDGMGKGTEVESPAESPAEGGG